MAVALPYNPFSLDTPSRAAGGPDTDDAEDVRLEGPYRIVLDRLRRLVRYRDQMLATLRADRGDLRAAAELVRTRHMIKEAHRAVSINASAKATAQQIDAGEPAWSAAYQ